MCPERRSAVPPEAPGRSLRALPPSPHSAAALERLTEAADQQGARAALDPILADPQLSAFLGSALGDCPFLLDVAAKDPARIVALLGKDPAKRVEHEIAALASAAWTNKPEAMAALRRAKQHVALTVGIADLGRAIPLETVTELLTVFADAALNAALRFALAEAARAGKWSGGAEARGFFILAMGKYGAGELNYSSDIDLIALFDPAAPGLAEGVEPSDFWVRIVRSLVTLLQERTADGYVFRTDLRLRPDPGATPPAISAPAALLYYESMGQNWERAALIKARAAAGDIAAGNAFVAELAPFIWRKYLDFAAIADIHSIKRQVHAHRGHAAVRVLGHNVKLGRGGIREIEFFVQTQQLIAGGRDRTLRGQETRAMLAKLAARGWIDEAARSELDDAYVFLRMVEHRLQMVRDEQTHILPRDRDELGRIGRLMGYADVNGFEADLRRTLEAVARRYSELFEDAPDLSAGAGSLVFTGGDDDPDTLATLRKLGFQDPRHVTQTVRAWHFGRFPAMRSTAARESLTEITPALLAAFGRAGNPDAALRAFDDLMKALPAGAQLFALLTNNRELLDLLATILGAAPRLAETFARRPHVVDALIDPASFGEGANRESLATRLEASLADASSYEDALNRTRLFAAEQRFLISIGLLRGTLDPSGAGKAFSDLAETIVRALFKRTSAEFERQHGRIPGGRAAVLAFGRLGSREMTVGSDLDLIVIYDHATDASSSDGKRPLPPSQHYIRLTQRLIAALAAPTAEGIAYAVDLRLRPSGSAGPLAIHIEALSDYQLNHAWTWEHLAMARGRPIAGDAELTERVESVLDRITSLPRDRGKLAKDVADMRARVEREKAAASLFDVKMTRGGLLDCEFAAQFLVLSGLGRQAGETTLETLRRAEKKDMPRTRKPSPLVGEGAPSLAKGRVRGAQAPRPTTPHPPSGGAGGHLLPQGEKVDSLGVLIRSAAVQGALLQLLRIADEKPFDPQGAPDALKRLIASFGEAALGDADAGDEALGAPSFEAFQKKLRAIQDESREALETLLGVPVDLPT
jgi:glutamate-ammonia-ligase adenylyltransferase